jgi:hypothetical protein
MLIQSLVIPDSLEMDNTPVAEHTLSPPSNSEVTNIDPWHDVFESDQHTPDTQLSSIPTEEGLNDDVWADDPEIILNTAPRDIFSDVPRLQAAHSTAGYRDGIAASKERFIQAGFDEGYQVGAEIGFLVGRVLGSLDALHTSLAPSSKLELRRRVEETVQRARRDLDLKEVFGRDYVGEDGVWIYEVEGGEEVSFEDIAAAHPRIREWSGIVRELAREVGLVVWRVEEEKRSSSSSDEVGVLGTSV